MRFQNASITRVFVMVSSFGNISIHPPLPQLFLLSLIHVNGQILQLTLLAIVLLFFFTFSFNELKEVRGIKPAGFKREVSKLRLRFALLCFFFP